MFSDIHDEPRTEEIELIAPQAKNKVAPINLENLREYHAVGEHIDQILCSIRKLESDRIPLPVEEKISKFNPIDTILHVGRRTADTLETTVGTAAALDNLSAITSVLAPNNTGSAFDLLGLFETLIGLYGVYNGVKVLLVEKHYQKVIKQTLKVDKKKLIEIKKNSIKKISETEEEICLKMGCGKNLKKEKNFRRSIELLDQIHKRIENEESLSLSEKEAYLRTLQIAEKHLIPIMQQRNKHNYKEILNKMTGVFNGSTNFAGGIATLTYQLEVAIPLCGISGALAIVLGTIQLASALYDSHSISNRKKLLQQIIKETPKNDEYELIHRFIEYERSFLKYRHLKNVTRMGGAVGATSLGITSLILAFAATPTYGATIPLALAAGLLGVGSYAADKGIDHYYTKKVKRRCEENILNSELSIKMEFLCILEKKQMKMELTEAQQFMVDNIIRYKYKLDIKKVTHEEIQNANINFYYLLQYEMALLKFIDSPDIRQVEEKLEELATPRSRLCYHTLYGQDPLVLCEA